LKKLYNIYIDWGKVSNVKVLLIMVVAVVALNWLYTVAPGYAVFIGGVALLYAIHSEFG